MILSQWGENFVKLFKKKPKDKFRAEYNFHSLQPGRSVRSIQDMYIEYHKNHYGKSIEFTVVNSARVIELEQQIKNLKEELALANGEIHEMFRLYQAIKKRGHRCLT